MFTSSRVPINYTRKCPFCQLIWSIVKEITNSLILSHVHGILLTGGGLRFGNCGSFMTVTFDVSILSTKWSTASAYGRGAIGDAI